ncbi:MAG: hypothetical protein A3F40_01810 [Chlamydiae bacterium RIFCSPHIGHO2_12_FULL_27_8]|nr:MAG: hypothetical protein A3F40_01810 [Chlamydiae bacterium RIFCSPHIGHO2_12_FULL_27_8]
MLLILYVLGIICFFINFYFLKERTKKNILELISSYIFLFPIGFGGLSFCVKNLFYPYNTASALYIEPNIFFQFQIGISFLSFSILSILCFFIKMKYFWMASIIGNSIFYFGTFFLLVKTLIFEKYFYFIDIYPYFFHLLLSPLILIFFYIWILKIKHFES